MFAQPLSNQNAGYNDDVYNLRVDRSLSSIDGVGFWIVMALFDLPVSKSVSAYYLASMIVGSLSLLFINVFGI